MSTRIFIGNALAFRGIYTATPESAVVDVTYTLTINTKDCSYTAVDGDGIAEVVAGLVTAWEALQADGVAEFLEADVASGTDANDDTAVVITGNTPGLPLTITGTTSAAGGGAVIALVRAGVAATNEQQTITVPPATGGTWTASYDNDTTGNLDFDATAFELRDALCDLDGIAGTDEQQTLTSTASGGTFGLTFEGQATANNALAFDCTAAQVVTALEGLSNVAAGDVTATGGTLDGTPIVITFRNNLGRSNRTEITVDNTNATGGTVVPSTNVAGVNSEVEVTRSGSGTGADPYIYVVEFVEGLAGINVPLITGDGTNLTGITGYITHQTVTDGSTTTNEVQSIALTVGSSTNDTLTITVTLPDGTTRTTGLIVLNANSGDRGRIETALNTALATAAASVVVTTTSTANEYEVEFFGSAGGANLELMTLAFTYGNFTGTVTEETAGSSSAVNEVQKYTIQYGPTGGDYTLTLGGETTAAIAFDADAATIEAAIELALSLAADVTVTVTTAGTSTIVQITWVDPSGTDVAQLTSTSSLTGGTPLVVQTQAAADGVNEIQSVTLEGATGGTFAATWDFGSGDETTGAIDWDATAAEVEAAIVALATPIAADIDVTGPDGGPWLVEFQGALAATDINLGTGDGANLTGTTAGLTIATSQAATGPNHWDNADNWSGGAVPVNSDDVIIQDTDVSILYGLAQSAVTLTSLTIDASFTGTIGLPERNASGYNEYRATYLAINATAQSIGQVNAAEAGSARIKIDNGSAQTTLNIYSTGFSQDEGLPAVLWKGTNASNVVNVHKGQFGAAVLGSETATIATLRQGYETDIDRDSLVVIGDGVSLTTWNKHGGEAVYHGAGATMTTLKHEAGQLVITDDAGAITTVNLRGGTIIDKSDSTWTALTVTAGATMDFSQGTKAKTLTATNVYPEDTTFLDPNKRLVYTAAVQVIGDSAKFRRVDWGKHVQIQVTAI